MLAGRAALTSPVLPVRLRELVVLRTAYLMDCPYELGQHRDVARTAGRQRRRDQRRHLRIRLANRPISSPIELAVLQLTTELLTTRSVSAEAVRSSAHGARLGGHRRGADGDQPLRGPGADAQRARRRPRRNRPAADPAEARTELTHMVTESGHTFQISSQYSAMARSDENFPLRAVFKMDIFVQRVLVRATPRPPAPGRPGKTRSRRTPGTGRRSAGCPPAV